MDLRFTPEETKFREEVRTFFTTAIPKEIRDKVAVGEHLKKEDMKFTQATLAKKGWAAPHWPKEWGGTGWDPIRTHIFNEEMQFNCVPAPLAFNTAMCGPVIINFGTEAQKKRFLPKMYTLEEWWCQGFSEPGAGSDLAGLKTTAIREGDHYIINGQKTWTTLAQHADWCFVLARTDPTAKKQLGISFILVDMKSPGIEVRPIQTIDGGHEVNEVFFTNVKVPVENLVGQEHRGWDCAKFLLGNERTNIARLGMSKQRLQRLKKLASKVMSGDKPLMEDERFAEKVAACEVELKALEMTLLRVLSEESKRRSNMPNPASSILKIKGSEIQQMTTELLMDVAGPLALPYVEDEAEFGTDEHWAAPAAPQYFNFRKVSIYGGSNEIQRNIIAKAVLGY
jgi:pimeloyl-CoA dehydrogenase large subunit